MKANFNDFKEQFRKFNIYQKIALAVLVISIPLCIGLGVSAVSSNSVDKNTESAVSSMVTSSESASSQVASSQIASSSQAQSKAPVKIRLVSTSVEEDLEVQILDEEGNLVTGTAFKLTVKGNGNGYSKIWTVDDGFLKLTKLASGEYSVSIAEVDGYIVPEEPVKVKIAKKVEYKEIDVSDKVVD